MKRRVVTRAVVLLQAITWIGGPCALVSAGSSPAAAACAVTPFGQVSCTGTTKTRRAVATNGDPSGQSDRTQVFDNGAAIGASIARGARIENGGLRLTEAAAAPRAVSVTNQGNVTSTKSGQTFRIDGNGGAIAYAGNGRITNPGKTGVALSVDNSGAGAASIATGGGLVSGGRGIVATTAGGNLTIATGAGRVEGTGGQGIQATTGAGALAVTVGKGGVSGENQEAIETTAAGGDTTIAVDGSVRNAGKAHSKKAPPAILAHSDGAGSIVVGGSGTVTSETGRGIWAQQRGAGTGGITIGGTGATNGLGGLCPGGHPKGAERHGETGCSGIRAVIKNTADASDITIDRSGNVKATSAGLNAITFGNGNIAIAPGTNARVQAKEFGVEVQSSGTGSVSVATSGAKSAIRTGGTGIIAQNFATAIAPAAGSQIAITTEGTVASSGSKFDDRNPRNFNGALAAVTAGYLGGAKPTSNDAVTGAVVVTNAGTLSAKAGDGIQAFDLGNGSLSVTNNGRIVAPTGIALFGGPTVTGTIVNTGNIQARAAAIDVTRANATTIDQRSGTIDGDIKLSGTGDTLNVGGGAIKGRILGNPAVDGAAAGTVDFDADLFRTGGTISAADVNVNGGTLSLADNVTVFGALTDNATLLLKGSKPRKVDGSYVQTDGATLAVPIGPGGGGRLVVTKSAELTGTLAVVVHRGPGGHFVPSGRYTILTAGGGVDGTFATIAPVAGARMPLLTYTANSVILTFPNRRSVFTFASTPNEAAAAGALQALPASSALARAVLSQNAAGARTAFDATSGEVYASTVTAAFEDSRLVREAILDRLAEADAFAAGTGWTVWSRDFGDFGRNGGDGNAATLDRSLAGFVIGADRQLDTLPAWRVGAAASYTNDSLDVAGRGSKATLSTGQAAIYAGARYGAWDVRLGATAGDSAIDTDRDVSFPGFADKDHAGYDDLIAQGFGEIGYRYGVGRATVEPLLTGAAIHISQSAFVEQGGTAALTSAGRGYDLGTTTLGVRGEMPVLAGVPLVVHVFAGWRHAYGDVDPTALLSFAAGSPSFVVAGVPIDRDALAVQAGLDWRTDSAVTLGLAYSGQIGGRAQDEAVRGRLEIAF